ncbi:MAG TPA: O-antigen ligase family protein [Candidatus Dormibacteraeota bacterium]
MATRVAEDSEGLLVRWSRLSLAVTAGCLPLYVVRLSAGRVHSTLLEVLIVITIALWVAGRATAGGWRPDPTWLGIPIALLLLAGLVGIAVSPDRLGAIGIYRAYFIEPVLLFYAAVDLFRNPDDFRVVLAGFAVGATVFAVMNLGAWVIALATRVDIDLGNAPKALYSSPNSVALYLEPPITLAAGFALYSGTRRDRVVALVCLPILLASMVATLSRGGLLTLAVLGVVGVLTLRSARLKLVILGALAIAAISILQIPQVSKRLAHQFDPSYPYNTFEGRLQIWSDTLHMLRDHPILGAGLRGYQAVMKPYVTTARHIPELYPHNILLDMWSGLGLLGLAVFVVLVAILLWRGWSSFGRAEGLARPLLWGTSAAFITVAVHGQFDSPYFGNDLSVEFWLVAALEVAAIMAFVKPNNPAHPVLRS